MRGTRRSICGLHLLAFAVYTGATVARGGHLPPVHPRPKQDAGVAGAQLVAAIMRIYDPLSHRRARVLRS